MKSINAFINKVRRTKSKSSKSSNASPSTKSSISSSIKEKMRSPFKFLRLQTPRTSHEKQPSEPAPQPQTETPTRIRAPGGPLNSNPVDLSMIPKWARNNNKEGTNNATNGNRTEDSDGEGDEIPPSDTKRSPRLKKIPKIDRLSLVLPDRTVLQAPNDDDEAPSQEIVHKRAVSLGVAALGRPGGMRENVGEGVGYKRRTRASTYDFGTLPNWNSQFFTSEDSASEGRLSTYISQFPLPPSTPTSKPLPSSSTTTPVSSRVSPSTSQHSHATLLSGESNTRVSPLASQRTHSTQTPLKLESTHSTQTPTTPQRTHSTQTSSTPQFSHSTQTPPTLPSAEPKEELEHEEKVIVVGISGISGSGKSTLAYLLNEIFNPETEEEKATGIRPQRILMQDDFFKLKEECPKTTFVVGGADMEFMEKTLKGDDFGLYTIEAPTLEKVHLERYDEVRGELCGKCEKCKVEGEVEGVDGGVDGVEIKAVNGNEGVNGDETGNGEEAVNGEVAINEEEGDSGDEEEGEDTVEVSEGKKWIVTETFTETVTHKIQWKVTGPDTDCAEAFDFEALEKAVRDLKGRGEVCSDSECNRRVRKLGLVENTGECISRNMVANDRKRSASYAGLENQDGHASVEKPQRQPKVQHVDNVAYLKSHYHNLITELRQRAQNFFSNSNKKVRFVFVEGMLLYTDPSSPSPNIRTQLQSHFDISLFLPTFIPTAKSRRFARPIYTLVKRPGQLWKTEGYFDDVVAKHYLQDHEWLLNPLNKGGLSAARSMRIEGIIARGISDWKVDEGCEWAVQNILYEAMGGGF